MTPISIIARNLVAMLVQWFLKPECRNTLWVWQGQTRDRTNKVVLILLLPGVRGGSASRHREERWQALCMSGTVKYRTSYGWEEDGLAGVLFFIFFSVLFLNPDCVVQWVVRFTSSADHYNSASIYNHYSLRVLGPSWLYFLLKEMKGLQDVFGASSVSLAVVSAATNTCSCKKKKKRLEALTPEVAIGAANLLRQNEYCSYLKQGEAHSARVLVESTKKCVCVCVCVCVWGWGWGCSTDVTRIAALQNRRRLWLKIWFCRHKTASRFCKSCKSKVVAAKCMVAEFRKFVFCGCSAHFAVANFLFVCFLCRTLRIGTATATVKRGVVKLLLPETLTLPTGWLIGALCHM